MPSFEVGTTLLRELAQQHLLPAVARLSDSDETRAAFAMSESPATQIARRYLAARGQRSPCVLLLGWEGSEDDVATGRRRVRPLLQRHGAVSLSTSPGRVWLRARYAAPYLRDALLDRGLLVETLETAATWSQLHQVHAAVRAALHASLTEGGSWPLIGCHVSHLYPEGASLYFTVLARQSAAPLQQWRSAKAAATAAMVRAGGVVSHHHGIGRDHAAAYAANSGVAGVAALRSFRRELDPAANMNPGVLLADT